MAYVANEGVNVVDNCFWTYSVVLLSTTYQKNSNKENDYKSIFHHTLFYLIQLLVSLPHDGVNIGHVGTTGYPLNSRTIYFTSEANVYQKNGVLRFCSEKTPFFLFTFFLLTDNIFN